MRSFWGLIPKNLWKNKKRTLIIGISIILAISLITCLSIVKENLIGNLKEQCIISSGGDYDIKVYTKYYSKIDMIRNDKLFKDVTVVNDVGVSKIENSDYKLDIKAYDDKAKEMLNFNLIEGKYPKNENEIALEKWVLDELDTKYEIGDKIKLQYSFIKSKNDQIKEETKEEEFTITGYFQYNDGSMNRRKIGMAYVPKEYFEKNLAMDNLMNKAYVSLEEDKNIGDALISLGIIREYKDTMVEENYTKVQLNNNIAMLNSIFKTLFFLIGIVAAIVIYNIFTIMVTERTRDFGVFRALGTSPVMIKLLVILEGIFLGIVFIPIGIIIGAMITSLITGDMNFVISIKSIPYTGIKVSFLVGLFSVILGSYFPARKASFITPMEAISSNNNLELKGHMLKTGLIIKDVKSLRNKFTFSMNMAYLNIARNKKRFITTVISLNVIIIMLFSACFFMETLDPVKTMKNQFKGEFIVNSTTIEGQNDGIRKNQIERIEKIDGVKEVFKKKELFCFMNVNREDVTNKGYKYLKAKCNNDEMELKKLEEGNCNFLTQIMGCDDEKLESIVKDIDDENLDFKKMKDEPLVLLAQNLKGDQYTTIGKDALIDISREVYDENGKNNGIKSATFKILNNVDGKNIEENKGNSNSIVILNNESMEKFLDVKNFSKINIKLEDNADYYAVKRAIQDIIKENRDLNLSEYKVLLESAKKENKELSVLSYGFIGIVALISVLNLINVMNMSVVLRKKDISMLRAIGFDNKQVKNMILSEGLFYGVASGGLGCILGTILSFILYTLTKSSLGAAAVWIFPIKMIVLVMVVIIVVCTVASLLPTRNIFKESIVDSIKSIE